MRQVGYLSGGTLLVLAGATLVAQMLSLLAHGGYAPIALDAIWSHVHAGSFAAVRRVVEEDLSPTAWPPILWVLRLPAWLILGIVGGLLFALCRPTSRTGRGFD